MTVGKDVEMYTKLGIIVDFDGTLSYLAKTPGNLLNNIVSIECFEFIYLLYIYIRIYNIMLLNLL